MSSSVFMRQIINMVDVESKLNALKTACVSRLSDSSISKMIAICRIYLKEIGINLQQVILMNFQHEKEFTEIKSIPHLIGNVY